MDNLIATAQVKERILVVLEPHAEIGRLLRTAKRKAETYNLDWEVLCIETPRMRQRMSDQQHEFLLATATLAEQMGAIVTRVQARSLIRGIQQVVAERLAQNIPLFSVKIADIRKHRLWPQRGKMLREKLREALDHKVPVATVPVGADSSSYARHTNMFHVNWREIKYSLLAVLLATVVVEMLLHFVPADIGAHQRNIPLLFITACTFAAGRYGLVSGIAAAVGSLLMVNMLYVAPYYSLKITTPMDVLNLMLFMTVALLIALLGSREHGDRYALFKTSERFRSLLRVHRVALNKDSREDTIATLDEEVRSLLGTDIVFYVPNSKDETRLEMLIQRDIVLNEDECKALQIAWMECKTTGVAAPYCPEGCRWRFEPMVTAQDEVGIFAVHVSSRMQVDVDWGQLVSGIADQVALIIERMQMGQVAQDNKIQAEREKLRAMLLSSVSHDLKTPLASVIGSLSVYRSMGATLSEEHRNTLINTALDEAQRLDSFITNILDMTRIESGQIVLKQEWVNPALLVDDVARRLRVRLRNHTLRIDATSPRNLLVMMDGLMIGQVIQNLLDNAGKYTPTGTQIDVSWSARNDRFEFSVRDHGEGIPEDKLEKVFDKYARIKKQDMQVAGTGLGLAIARAVMQAQGGNIRAANHPDGGAMFILSLPKFREALEHEAA